MLFRSGMGWVDAPLSGGAPAATQGRMTLMVGGSEADVARAAPLFDHLSNRWTHLGASGAGQTVKAINQILCANAFLAVAEAVRFAEAHGVDATRIPEALAGGRADSCILQEFMAKMALAAVQGGAVAIRANSPVDVAAIRRVVSVPIIGLWKRDLPGYAVRITPRQIGRAHV